MLFPPHFIFFNLSFDVYSSCASCRGCPFSSLMLLGEVPHQYSYLDKKGEFRVCVCSQERQPRLWLWKSLILAPVAILGCGFVFSPACPECDLNSLKLYRWIFTEFHVGSSFLCSHCPSLEAGDRRKQTSPLPLLLGRPNSIRLLLNILSLVPSFSSWIPLLLWFCVQMIFCGDLALRKCCLLPEKKMMLLPCTAKMIISIPSFIGAGSSCTTGMLSFSLCLLFIFLSTSWWDCHCLLEKGLAQASSATFL